MSLPLIRELHDQFNRCREPDPSPSPPTPLPHFYLQHVARWAALLQPLSQSLLTNLAIARSECPSLLRAYLEEGSPATPPILNLAAANLLGLLIRSALCGGGAGLAFRVCARHTAHPQPVIGQCPMPAYQVSTVRGGEGHAATHPYNTAHAHTLYRHLRYLPAHSTPQSTPPTEHPTQFQIQPRAVLAKYKSG